MTGVLKKLLTEYVDEVEPYDVRANALRLGKRRRVMATSSAPEYMKLPGPVSPCKKHTSIDSAGTLA